jgi:putative transcriptional regulator
MDAATHAKITLRHLSDNANGMAEPITGDEIRTLREEAHLSQAVVARYLNFTVACVSQLERGARRRTGPALVLLNVIRKQGYQCNFYERRIVVAADERVSERRKNGNYGGFTGPGFSRPFKLSATVTI